MYLDRLKHFWKVQLVSTQQETEEIEIGTFWDHERTETPAWVANAAAALRTYQTKTKYQPLGPAVLITTE